MSGSEEGDMASVEALEMLKEEVITKLKTSGVPLLTEICVENNVTIPIKKAGIKSALFNLMVRYLSSPEVEESGDAGLQMLTDLKGKLDNKLGLGTEENGGVKTEGGNLVANGKQVMSKTAGRTDQAGSSTTKQGSVGENGVPSAVANTGGGNVVGTGGGTVGGAGVVQEMVQEVVLEVVWIEAMSGLECSGSRNSGNLKYTVVQSEVTLNLTLTKSVIRFLKVGILGMTSGR